MRRARRGRAAAAALAPRSPRALHPPDARRARAAARAPACARRERRDETARNTRNGATSRRADATATRDWFVALAEDEGLTPEELVEQRLKVAADARAARKKRRRKCRDRGY